MTTGNAFPNGSEQPPTTEMPPGTPAIESLPLEGEALAPPRVEIPPAAEAVMGKAQREAKLAADTTEVLHHPAFRAITEIDPEEVPLSPIDFYVQQMAIGYKVGQTTQDARAPLVNSEIFGMFNRQRKLSLCIKSAHNLHVMINGMALHAGVSRDEFAANFSNVPTEDMIRPLFQDYLLLGRGRFVSKHGVKEEFHQAAMRLRMLTVALLFSPQANDPDHTKRLFKTMYDLSAEHHPPVDEADVELYAQELGKEASSGKRLQKLNKRFGKQSLPLLHRATEKLLMSNAEALFLSMSPEQIYHSRQAYRNAFGAMVGSDLERLHEKATAVELALKSWKDTEAPEVVEQIIEASQLDWEALPPGELEQHAREIVEAAQANERTSSPVVIDLSRLRTLSNLRALLGEDRCYFARGKLGARRKVTTDGVEQADQYLLLVYRDLDDQGNMRGESVIAESPIANKHAMYVFRYDVSGDTDWRSVMALPKNMARDLGARSVKHVLPDGEPDLVGAMTRKAMALLSCAPETFSSLVFAGARGVRLPRAALPKPPEA